MPSRSGMQDSSIYDVVICGGGLAGLGLARQLKLAMPDLKILLIEKQKRPLPAACHKVGESTVEGATHWLSDTLGLKGYLERAHLRKFGLRFFVGGPVEPFESRLELGASTFSTIPSYQLDRGVLENDLRRMVGDAGVALLEGWTVTNIALEPDGPHRVDIRNGGQNTRSKVAGRWVVDALGRRRLLQRSLGLLKASEHRASACWWRVAGKVDVTDLVPSSKRPWHERVEESRWLSTNHLMGDGYWVWLIPLSSGATSIGIVASEERHPIKDRSSYSRSVQWLAAHEPDLAKLIDGRPPMDFLALKHFAHQARQVFSAGRWCTIGEAGVFTDPLYSHGSDLIAWASTITTHLIRLEREGNLNPGLVALYNGVFLGTVRTMTELFHDMYRVFGDEEVMLQKLLWDCAYYWTFVAPVIFKRILEQPKALSRYLELAQRFQVLNKRFQETCRCWSTGRLMSRLDPGRYGFRRCSWVNEIRLRIPLREAPEEFLAGLESALERFEEMAQVVLQKALDDVDPDARQRLSSCRIEPVPSSQHFDVVDMQAQLEQYTVPICQ